jgi:hypothetical protein
MEREKLLAELRSLREGASCVAEATGITEQVEALDAALALLEQPAPQPGKLYWCTDPSYPCPTCGHVAAVPQDGTLRKRIAEVRDGVRHLSGVSKPREMVRVLKRIAERLDAALLASVPEPREPEPLLRELVRRFEVTLGPWAGAPYMEGRASGPPRCVFCGEDAVHDDDCPALLLRAIGAAPTESEVQHG